MRDCLVTQQPYARGWDMGLEADGYICMYILTGWWLVEGLLAAVGGWCDACACAWHGMVWHVE